MGRGVVRGLGVPTRVPGAEGDLRGRVANLGVGFAVHDRVYAPQSEFEQERQVEEAPEGSASLSQSG